MAIKAAMTPVKARTMTTRAMLGSTYVGTTMLLFSVAESVAGAMFGCVLLMSVALSGYSPDVGALWLLTILLPASFAVAGFAFGMLFGLINGVAVVAAVNLAHQRIRDPWRLVSPWFWFRWVLRLLVLGANALLGQLPAMIAVAMFDLGDQIRWWHAPLATLPIVFTVVAGIVATELALRRCLNDRSETSRARLSS